MLPFVRIDIVKGHTSEYKKTFLESVHDALESALGIPDWDRFQRLCEIESDCFERGKDKTDNFCIIELTIFPGRSKELKASIIKGITRLLEERLQIAPSDIFIVIHDPPLENWGFAGIQKGS